MSRYPETPHAALMLDEIEDCADLIEELAKVIDTGGSTGAAIHNRAVARWKIGQLDGALAGFDEALAALDRAIAIAPGR